MPADPAKEGWRKCDEGTAGPAQKRKTIDDLDLLWTALGSSSVAEAEEAIWTLAEARDKGVAAIAERLKRKAEPSEEQAQKARELIRKLDDDEFRVRDEATQELAKLGLAAERFLTEALRAKPSPEARLRMEKLLQELRGFDNRLRAIRVLELVGTEEAKALLRELGPEGQAALERLK
jgi:hypothetical protein